MPTGGAAPAPRTRWSAPRRPHIRPAPRAGGSGIDPFTSHEIIIPYYRLTDGVMGYNKSSRQNEARRAQNAAGPTTPEKEAQMPTNCTLSARIANGTPRGERTTLPAEIPADDEPRLSARILAAINTTEQRADTLWADGYTMEPIDAVHLVYFVRRPRPLIDTRTGETTEGYTVDVRARTCSCPMWERSMVSVGRGVCKHLVAVVDRVTDALRTLGLAVADPEPVETPTRWEVWEFDAQLGEITSGHTFDSQAAAQAWCDEEESWARAGGERVPVLRIRPVESRVVWGREVAS